MLYCLNYWVNDLEKDLLFISHASHEDDYPAGWLASKLKSLGYRVFVDLQDLKAGDTFYTIIQPKIQQEAIKFITVNTKHYLHKAGIPTTGVRKEINTATTVDDGTFIIPIRFDQVDWKFFPSDYVGRNGVDFYNRWGPGFQELIDNLLAWKIPRESSDRNPLQLWHETLKVRNTKVDGEEKILTNWFPINLPDQIYFHLPSIVGDPALGRIPATTIKEGKGIITFAPKHVVSEIVPLTHSFQFATIDFANLSEVKISDNVSIVRPVDKLKSLLNKSFKSHCRWKQLKLYKQSGEKEVYYFSHDHSGKRRSVSLRRHNRGRVYLVGNRAGRNWHFAVSAKSELFPLPHFRLWYHVIFTDKHEKLLSIKEQHKCRRGFGTLLNNKKTLELLLGAMQALSASNESDRLEFRAGEDVCWSIGNSPISFNSMVTYVEPDTALSDDLY